MGIQVPQLGRGYARFLLPFKPELANAIGLLQGGMIAALADEAVAYALYSLVAARGNHQHRGDEDQFPGRGEGG